jgi:cytidine deaminase
MQEKKIEFHYTEYALLRELDASDIELAQAAIDITEKAYAKYSGFHVGAAVRLKNGIIITGNNQENAAYPSGLCAERVALFYANAQYPDEPIVALAVAAKNHDVLVSLPTAPCGACRQVILETEVRFQQPIRMILVGQDKIFVVPGVKELLPLSFDFHAFK